MSTRPVIGITTYGRNAENQFYLPGAYVDAVHRARGFPILLTPGERNVESILELVDGLVFSGGGDIDPIHYSGAGHPMISEVDPERDSFELELARQIFSASLPVLGICRGRQILNLASGGDLVAHLPDQFGTEIKHIEDKKSTTHTVELSNGGQLAEIFRERSLSVVSKHHQAVNRVSADWRVAAQAADGVIEAMEFNKRPWLLGVQWHPETGDDPRQQKLFEALAAAAGEIPNHCKRWRRRKIKKPSHFNCMKAFEVERRESFCHSGGVFLMVSGCLLTESASRKRNLLNDTTTRCTLIFSFGGAAGFWALFRIRLVFNRDFCGLAGPG